MYGLPVDFDVLTFVGKRLDLICFSSNTITLSFEGGILITMMDSFIHRQNKDGSANKQSVPVVSSNLMCLANRVVCHAEGCEDGTFALHFDNGHILVLLDDSREYESYSIRIGNKEIIV